MTPNLHRGLCFGLLILGFDTPIGPLYACYGSNDDDQDSAFVYLGPRFTF